MKHTRNIRAFFCGVLVTLLVVGMSNSAMAVLASRTIQVYTGVDVYVDDQKLEPKDANGNPVEVFAYNGTTYLPLRAVGNALGLPVQWEGSTESVYIGKHNGDTPAAYLCELDYFTMEGRGWEFGGKQKDNLGKEHNHIIKPENRHNGSGKSVTYVLNGQYSRLTAVYFLDYEQRSDDYRYTLTIYGDGRELWKGTVSAGIEPIDIDLDLTGVLKLTLENGGYFSNPTTLGDVALWT